MELVVDANVLISALIANSTTRELLVTIEPRLSTPETVKTEIDRYEPQIVAKSGMDAERVAQFLGLLFDHVETVPAASFHPEIDRAEAALGHVDPDDVLYLACACHRDAGIWSDDRDFDAQDLVPVFTTSEVLDEFGPIQ